MSQRRLPVPDLRLSDMLRRTDDRLGRMERLLLRDPKVVGSTLSQTFITALTQNITTIQNITNITNISNFITQIFTTGGGSGRLLRYTAFDARVWTPGDIGSIVLQELTKMLIVELVGPGGGAGNGAWGSVSDTAAGGGGGGGAYTLKVYDLAHNDPAGYLAPTGGMTLYWKLGIAGVGGVAGAGSAHNGTAGGDTKFDLGADGSEGGSQLGPTIRAVGGGGGSGGDTQRAGDVAITDGGAGGQAQAAALDGTLVAAAGAPGDPGLIISNSDGTAAKAHGGFGGASGHGSGRAKGGYDSGSDPDDGHAYGGGGGGGAASESGPARKGGDGGPALIIVRELS